MPTPSHILLADFSDWLRIIIPIVFVTLYSIQQWVGSLQEAKRKAAKKQQPRPVPPPEMAVGRQPAVAAEKPAGATLEETLRREVEEFLRRAQGQPPGQQAPPQARPAQATRPAAQQRPASPPRERPAARQAQRSAAPTPAAPRRLVDEPRSQPTPVREAPRPLGGSLSQQVAEHLRGAEAVAQHARTLGAEISQADERLEQHLREKFQHQVGVLAPATTREDARRAAGSTAAQELREMLARPGGARQLIIASEILRRPEERW